MGRFFTLGLALAAIWLLLSGYFHDVKLLTFGALSVVLCVFLAARVGFIDPEGVPVAMITRIVGYWIWLGVEIGKANIAVAHAVLAIHPRLSPKIVRVPMTQKTNAGRATFANSITLTPGTVSIDMGDGEIVVHALTEGLADVAAMADMGERVTRTEGGPR
jgi:multicomponent Na+:H+ antiporter subunit E